MSIHRRFFFLQLRVIIDMLSTHQLKDSRRKLRTPCDSGSPKLYATLPSPILGRNPFMMNHQNRPHASMHHHQQ